MGIFQKLRALLGKAENAAGEEYGELEEKLGRPLYPIQEYQAVVDPGKLIRGAWPSKTVLTWLKQEGVGTVMNLCAERSQQEDVCAAGMKEVWMRIRDNTVPIAPQVQFFLDVVNLNQNATYVHCEQGKGRTGCMVAAYRVLEQGWSPERALAEAEIYGLALPADRQFVLDLGHLFGWRGR